MLGWSLTLFITALGFRHGLYLPVLLSLFTGPLFLLLSPGRRAWFQKNHCLKKAALRIEKLNPSLGSAPTAALAFSKESKEVTDYSRDLLLRYIAESSEALQQSQSHQVQQKENRQRRKIPLIGSTIALIFALFSTWMLPNARIELLRATVQKNITQLSERPLGSDIRLIFHYPAYAKRENRIIQGGDGTIRCLAGTDIELIARSEEKLEHAVLRLNAPNSEETQDLAVVIGEDGQTLSARFTVMKPGSWVFIFKTQAGKKIQEKHQHPIFIEADSHPKVQLISPTTEVELRDDDFVDIFWSAEDDFEISEVSLVLERPGQKEPIRTLLAPPEAARAKRDGKFRWKAGAIELEPGEDALFYLEATDNDTVMGPKKGRSQTRKLKLFSARRHHQKTLQLEEDILNDMVDWLSEELTHPVSSKGPISGATLEGQSRLLQTLSDLLISFEDLLSALDEDHLSPQKIKQAFRNIQKDLDQEHQSRRSAIKAASKNKKSSSAFRLFSAQIRSIKKAEKHIIYLDDLIALQRVQSLKDTAKDLLSAQRDLESLLEEFRKNQDPRLKAELEERIRALKEKMMQLLAKMASIRKELPGEYRNLEATGHLATQDQLKKLEKYLEEGDLEAAARELEALANTIENMVASIDEAEEKFGGERYEKLRKELADFAEDFQKLEEKQKALHETAEKLAEKLRKEAIKKAAGNKEKLLKKAMELVTEALEGIDQVAEAGYSFAMLDRELSGARIRLLDVLDLLDMPDYEEALNMSHAASRHLRTLSNVLRSRYNALPTNPELKKSRDGTEVAKKATLELVELLEKLFPKARDVLSKQELKNMKEMAKEQKEVQDEAAKLQSKMQKLAQEIPIFGAEPQQMLKDAQSHMRDAQNNIKAERLQQASQNKGRAAEKLGALRKKLQQAAKGGSGGMPLPLGGEGGQGQKQGFKDEDVDIPKDSANKGREKFRKDLLEAAREKAPEGYKEAVRRYYEELIR